MTRRARARGCAVVCEAADAPRATHRVNVGIWATGPERAQRARMITQTEEPKKLDQSGAPPETIPEPRESDVIDDLEPYNLPFTD